MVWKSKVTLRRSRLAGVTQCLILGRHSIDICELDFEQSFSHRVSTGGNLQWVEVSPYT